MEENRFEIVECTKKYNGSTAYSLQRCNVIVGHEVVSTFTMETKLRIDNPKILFEREADAFLGIVNSLAKKGGYPVYDCVKI